MRRGSFFFFVMCLLAPFSFAEEVPAWKSLPAALSGERINRVFVDPENSKRVYLLTTNGLLTLELAQDGVLRVPQRLFAGNVHDAVIQEKGGGILAATDEGLQFSSNRGKNWRNIVSGQEVFSVLKEGGKYFIGLGEGLHVLREDQRMAFRVPGDLGHKTVRILRRSPGGILAVTNDSVYVIRPGEDMPEMILKVSGEEEFWEEDAGSFEEEQADSVLIRALEVFEGVIYVVSSEGIFTGHEGRGRWEQMPAEGLSLKQINALTVLHLESGDPFVCVAGSQGVQCRLQGAWVSVNRGLGALECFAIQSSRSGDLIVAGEGIFLLPGAGEQKFMAMANILDNDRCAFREYVSLQNNFVGEPTVKDVQRMVIRYSDTDKSKIDAWQRQSRIKAFIPSVSAGVGRGAGELFHWDTGPNPDVLQKGREYRDWDFSMTWDLSDVVWSTNQTSIDSRSKLMVELRQQVLDQATRLYFERRRIQIELVSCRYPSEGERMAAEMRVDELTAHIDSYTGGEFSKRLSQQKNT